MSGAAAPVEIPNRALFKATEVCELAKVQPYVLRSWEAEFPDLGVAKTAGAPRVYRRSDVEQVLRIKHLLLVEGLTLAGARRRLLEEAAPVAAEAPLEELVGRNARERLTVVKRGLRSILDLLASAPMPSTSEFRLSSPASSAHLRAVPAGRSSARAKPPRGKVAASRASARRKRA